MVLVFSVLSIQLLSFTKVCFQGGGATFGVMISVTVKTFPEMPVATLSTTILGAENSEAFWNASTFILSQSPRLADSGVVGYSYLSSAYPYNGSVVSGYVGQFLMPNATSADLLKATSFLREYVSSITGVIAVFAPAQYPSLYAWYKIDKNTNPVGNNEAIASRLLDAKALSDVKALRAAMETSLPAGGLVNVNLVSGPGLWHAKPPGGSDSVNPGWRKSYLEYGMFRFIVLRGMNVMLTLQSCACLLG